jgi:hypothetical protein
VLGFNCRVTAGFASAVPDSALLTEVESCVQAASVEMAAHPRTHCATRGASAAIDPAWRLSDVIKDPLIGTGALHSEAEGGVAIDHNAGTCL